MFEPVKVAFAEYVGRFYQSLYPTTRGMDEYCKRGLEKAVAWVPGRMVDAAEEMLDAWQRNDTDSAATLPRLPVVLIAMSKDVTPSGRDYTRQIADAEWFTFACDPKERAFKVKTMSADVRAQLAIFAHDEPTARAIAAQWLLFTEGVANRGFASTIMFSGMEHHWPVRIENPSASVMSIQTDAKNITLLSVDVMLKASIPLFFAPKVGEPNDGKGDPANPDDLAGFPVLGGLNYSSNASAP